MPFKKIEDAEKSVEAARLFYLEIINRAAEQAGSYSALARKLGIPETTVRNSAQQGTFSSVRRIAKLITIEGDKP